MTVRSIADSPAGQSPIYAPVCVIGAGLAGLLVARRLAQGGQRVIVVESGGETVTEEVGRLNEIDDATGRYTRATTGRYRGLGGSSSRWGGRLIPVSRHDTSARPYISSPAWPFPIEELSQYEEEIESLFQVSPGSYEDIPSEQEAEQRAFPKDDRSILPRWAKCPNFKNCNLATLLADELRTSDRMEIWLEATVCDFELDRDAGRLVGITARDFSGHVLRVRADRFVIAAGGIEATRLLLLLDEVSQNRAFERCEVLGKFFQDHLKAEVATISRRDPSVTNRLFGYRFVDGTRRDLHLELPAAVQERDRVASAFGYVAMDLADSPLSDLKKLAQGLQRREFDAKAVSRASRNIGLLTKTAWWRIVENRLFVPADVDLRLMVCVEQLPHAQNRIGLSAKRDRLGNRLARFEWTPTQSDEETFRSAIAAIRAFWAAAGFDRRCPLEWQPCAVDASQPVISRAEACAHPSGSTRMGVEPVGSVVGPDLHCHAVPNVAVVGASVFPTAGSANPTLTIMELAYWLADFCLRDRTPAGAPPVSLMSA